MTGADLGAAQGLLIDAHEELTRLRRENRRLRDEIRTQRRALAFLNRRSQRIRAELAASEIDRWEALFEAGRIRPRAQATVVSREAPARCSPTILSPVERQSPVGPSRALVGIVALILGGWSVLIAIGYALAQLIPFGWP